MTQLHPHNLRDQALAVLKLRLISGDLAPGELYSAPSLAAELGVSSSPVREALLTLVNQGLMEAVRNRGFRVLPCSQPELDNICAVRLMLEVPAMSQVVAERRIEGHQARFEALVEEVTEAARKGDTIGFLDADRRFHVGLLSLLGNDTLTGIVGTLREQSRAYGLKSFSERGSLAVAAQEHRAILDAILAGSVERTATLMTEHLTHMQRNWSQPASE